MTKEADVFPLVLIETPVNSCLWGKLFITGFLQQFHFIAEQFRCKVWWNYA